MDMTAAAAIGNSLNIALNISKTMLGIRDQAMIQEKVVELTGQIINAQQSAIAALGAQQALENRVRELEEELMKTKNWETTKEHYELRGVAREAVAYTQKKGMENGEPPHWLCPTCFQKQQKSYLQGAGPAGKSGAESFQRLWKCPTCNTTIVADRNVSPENPRKDVPQTTTTP